MEIHNYIPGIICIVAALIIMLRLMHYAHFFATSYFFWIGAILTGTGIISLIHPLEFLFVFDRTIAAFLAGGGAMISLAALLFPVKLRRSATSNKEIDALMPEYAFDEFHEVKIKAGPEKVKQVLHVTGVKDIPAVYYLMKIRGIADEDTDMSDRASKSNNSLDTFSTPDFNFFKVAPDEYVTLMIIKSGMMTDKNRTPAPPDITTIEQFTAFDDPGYVKVTMNFRFISADNDNTVLTTETRVAGITPKDSRVFSRYWRIIYPGSAIIRRVWLDTIKKKAEK